MIEFLSTCLRVAEKAERWSVEMELSTGCSGVTLVRASVASLQHPAVTPLPQQSGETAHRSSEQVRNSETNWGINHIRKSLNLYSH